jgi:hypothetical protein
MQSVDITWPPDTGWTGEPFPTRLIRSSERGHVKNRHVERVGELTREMNHHGKSNN